MNNIKNILWAGGVGFFFGILSGYFLFEFFNIKPSGVNLGPLVFNLPSQGSDVKTISIPAFLILLILHTIIIVTFVYMFLHKKKVSQELKILHAKYGVESRNTEEVTDFVKSEIKDGSLQMNANNKAFDGLDPVPGEHNKILTVLYSYQGKIFAKSVIQHDTISLP